MLNPFLTLRLAFLALMVYMNLIVLIFASWNIRASSGADIGASTSSVVLILTNCATFIAVATALAELLEPTCKLAVGWFECLWTAVVGNVQIAAAIGATVDSSVLMCRQQSSWGACASASLLVPSAWIAGIIAVSYFLLLLFALIAHRNVVPDIWTTSVHVPPWFFAASSSSSSKLDANCRSSDVLSIKAAGDLESFRRLNIRRDPPTWAQSHQVVRGRQAPFAKPSAPPIMQSSAPPSVQSRTSLPPQVSIHFLDRDRDTKIIAGMIPDMTPLAPPPPTSFRPTHQLQRSGTSFGSSSSSLSLFPEGVANHDLPIPHARESQWIRADTPV
ncbi:hypothetical protein BDV98DRAFT_588135 [Pterulicium gracile]|uniref:Uncharacterized protein n=1 Tax=Pterulicium gracile TaxID=1884261 RepID=A0A5C3R8B0_9AGAR|nr:hypothetical protein BDV98DRAFT_588135 [Pterula gracilis]